MSKESHETISHKLISDLKFDVEVLKKKLTQPDTKINELILEIESMKDSIHELNAVFEKALQETKDDDLTANLSSLTDKLDEVISQNETIARGMVAVSDKLDVFMRQNSRGGMHTMGVPQIQQQGVSRIAPRPEEEGIPPPPTANRKRAGLF